MPQVQSTEKLVDDTVLMRTSSRSPSSTANSEHTSDSGTCNSSESIVSLVTKRQMPTIKKIQKIVEFSQVPFVDEVVGMPVAMKRQVRAIETRKRPGSFLKSSTSTRSLAFPSRFNTRFPQFQCDERQMLEIQMCNKTTRGASTGSAH